jgi:CubicO group peptidase (beta-lactamase class C family)
MSICRVYIMIALLAVTAAGQRLVAPPDARSRVDRIFAQFDRVDGPGCAVGASIAGEPVLRAGYGMADLEHDIKITPETVFEPGSVTKQFTAAAVLLLAQEGKLSLDDPVRKYFPELPDYGAPLTVRHLLNHTSGLRDWGNLEAIAGWPRTTRAYTHAHVLEILSKQRALNYTPGTEYSYTNSGYNLAAMLVARVSGKSLPDFTKERIFVPLGMNATEWRDDFRRIVHGRAIAYSAAGSTFRQDMPFENVYGNGGLLTTIGDLLRWNRNFTEMKVGGRALVEAQQQRARLNDGRLIGYAAGLFVGNWKGLPEVSHSGSTAGYSAWLGRYPEQGVSVAVLCNLAGTNATQLGRQVAEVYLGDAVRNGASTPVTIDAARAGLYRSTRDHTTITLAAGSAGTRRYEFQGTRMRIASDGDDGAWYDKVELAKPGRVELGAMAGDYSSDEAEVAFHVALDGDRLVMRRRPDSVIPLTPTYTDGFACSLGSVRFLRDTAGGVTGMSIGEGRVWDLRLKRM